jgi:hypothetical protein
LSWLDKLQGAGGGNVEKFVWNGLEVTVRPLNDKPMKSVVKAVAKKPLWPRAAPKNYVQNRMKHTLVASVAIENDVVHLIYPPLGKTSTITSLSLGDKYLLSGAYRIVYHDICYHFLDRQFTTIVNALKLRINPSAYMLIAE